MSTMKITLGGVDYQIPALVIKQNRHVEPLAVKHGEYFLNVMREGGKVKLLHLNDEQAEDFTRIVYHALTRVQPGLTWAQFEEMPITMREILGALPACLQQSGLFREADRAAPPTGEAAAQSPSTGTPSSPSSATA